MIKEFKNTLHLKLDKNEVGEIKDTILYHDILYLLYANYDLMQVGDEFCVSNYAMGFDVMYNGGSGFYRLTTYQFEDLKKGKTIILPLLDDEYVREFVLPEFDN